MGILRTISELGEAAYGIGMTHDTVKKFHGQYIAPALESHRHKSFRLMLEPLPSAIAVNQPVTFAGTGTGLISIYSSNVLEREVYADKSGWWGTRLYFSKAGEYDMIITDSALQRLTFTVKVD